LVRALLALAALAACGGPTTARESAREECPDWGAEFAALQSKLAAYRQGIVEAARAENRGLLPVCAPATGAAAGEPRGRQPVTVRTGAIALTELEGFGDLAGVLPEFSYIVVPPRQLARAERPLRTMIMLAGGPGRILSEDS
jgi:hypothetical protein